MTVKKIEIVSVTIPEWNLLDKARQLLEGIAVNTDMPISDTAADAAEAIATVMSEIEEVSGC